jgi:hypothetical protein
VSRAADLSGYRESENWRGADAELWNFLTPFAAFCNLTHSCRNKQNVCVLGFETVNASNGDRVLLSCNSWRQARVCMALARASDEPALKQYYEELA